MNRITNSWELVKASMAVLRADKELLLFPVVSMLASIAVFITFLVPMILAGMFDSLFTEGSSGVLSAVVGFLFYVVMYFVTIFSNSALVGAAMIRMEGGDPTLGDGFRIALKHVGQTFIYAVISATVGMILRALSERGGIIGSIVSGIIGFAWGVLTFLVVPVLVVEEVGPIDAIKRSGELLKRTWGEQIIGNFGIGAIFGLAMLGVILISIPLFILAASLESVALILGVLALLVLSIVALGLLSSALNGIYTAAVYQYAISGQTSGYFRADLVENAFKPKRG